MNFFRGLKWKLKKTGPSGIQGGMVRRAVTRIVKTNYPSTLPHKIRKCQENGPSVYFMICTWSWSASLCRLFTFPIRALLFWAAVVVQGRGNLIIAIHPNYVISPKDRANGGNDGRK